MSTLSTARFCFHSSLAIMATSLYAAPNDAVEQELEQLKRENETFEQRIEALEQQIQKNTSTPSTSSGNDGGLWGSFEPGKGFECLGLTPLSPGGRQCARSSVG